MESSAGSFNSFAEAFEQETQSRADNVRPGKIVTGKVVNVGREMITVDIGFKSEGVIPVDQFKNQDGAVTAQIGDDVEVCILAFEGEGGQIQLSKEKAEHLRVWVALEEAQKKGETVQGKVTHKVKGGLQVDVGIPAFLPGSQIDTRPHRNLDKFLNEVFDFKVIKVTRDKGNIVLSRRAVLQSERDELRSETLKVLSEGVVMEGTVKNVTEYGAFIDLGGIDGLLHITDITWGRINHPSEKLSVGQTVPVVVLKYDESKERVSLGMKQLKQDPWLTVNERYPVNGRINGRVTSVTDYGAFVEIEDGVEGLIHVSEMSWTRKNKHPSKIVAEGDKVEAIILQVDNEQRRISLGLKQLQSNPWIELQTRLPVGTKITRKIRSIVDYGMFVEIEEGIDGLVHVSDFSWTKRFRDAKEIQEVYKKGDDIEALVLAIDSENERVSLGIKQLEMDPWDTIAQRFPVGLKVKGTVSSHAQFGMFVKIEDDIEGLVHNSHMGLNREQKADELFPVGKEIETEVVGLDRNERRISLSMKELTKRENRADYQKYMVEEGKGSGFTLGELLGGKK